MHAFSSPEPHLTHITASVLDVVYWMLLLSLVMLLVLLVILSVFSLCLMLTVVSPKISYKTNTCILQKQLFKDDKLLPTNIVATVNIVDIFPAGLQLSNFCCMGRKVEVVPKSRAFCTFFWFFEFSSD